MAVGDIEQLVEGLVNRGLVSPKMVGRTVGQATIEQLKNLGNNVAESQMRLQREQEERISSMKVNVAKQLAQATQFRNQSRTKGGRATTRMGNIQDITKPFAVGYTKQSLAMPRSLAVAIPTDRGFELRTGPTDPLKNALSRLALENIGVTAPREQDVEQLPVIHTEYMGAKPIGSLSQLLTEIAGQSPDIEAIKRIFGGLE